MTTIEGRNITRKKLVNANLISLKCLLFCFFGGMGCLFPFLPLHMLAVGLDTEDGKIISIVSALVATLGPLVAGPLADKLAGRQGSNSRASTGKYLRVMITLACILAAVFYSALMLVPKIDRLGAAISQDSDPPVKLACDRNGAIIVKDRCNKVPATCHRWDDIKPGNIRLRNCRFDCYPSNSPPVIGDEQLSSSTAVNLLPSDVVEQTTDDGIMTVAPIDSERYTHSYSDLPFDGPSGRKRRYVNQDNGFPHLCVKDSKSGAEVCHVYTNSTSDMTLSVTLQHASNPDEYTKKCIYPIGDEFSCRIPENLEIEMMKYNQSCSIQCDLDQPYNITGSVLSEAQCQQVIGDPELTFWLYLALRSIADIFPTTAVTLLDAAVVIATRETSCGRGDVGRQLAFGSLGFALFGPVTGYLTILAEGNPPAYYLPITLFSVMMIISALIALFSDGMPLSPPEWWWHTRSGMLALPMSAIKRYGSETAALVFVLVIMGIFWSAMDTFLPWHLIQLNANVLLIGVCLTIGALPAVIFLWKSEHLVDYCGHSNLLITAFTIYIVRFTGLSLVRGDPWWSLVSEALELFTLGIMWVTAILYLRHLVPRHLTVTAQALPVIAHFCIGRCIGAVISAYVDIGKSNVDSLTFVYQCMAIASAVIAFTYFSLYHALLKPKCHPQSTHGPRQPPTIMQAMNGNGNYTPLRVYHNGRGRKGQFRY